MEKDRISDAMKWEFLGKAENSGHTGLENIGDFITRHYRVIFWFYS